MISIIIPIYHGEKYIPGLINQLEKNAGNVRCSVEMILVHDDPEIEKKKYSSNSIRIKQIYTNENVGIHGARLKGLYASAGEYVLFLDQDDLISDDYLKLQRSSIENNDASLCMAYENEKLFYSSEEQFLKIITKDVMFKQRNMIISPGQVLLKRSAIPKKWIDTSIKHNGADDYFLWICMIHEEKKFALLNMPLFVHRVKTGENNSANLVEMMHSVREVIEKCTDYLDCTELEYLELADFHRREEKLRELMSYKKKSYYLDLWMRLRDKNHILTQYFTHKNWVQVSIYGLGVLGRHLFYELDGKIEVKHIFDRKKQKISERTSNDFDVELVENEVVVLTMWNKDATLEELFSNSGKRYVWLIDILEQMNEFLDE